MHAEFMGIGFRGLQTRKIRGMGWDSTLGLWQLMWFRGFSFGKKPSSSLLDLSSLGFLGHSHRLPRISEFSGFQVYRLELMAARFLQF